MNLLRLKVSEVHFPGSERLRRDYGDIKSLMTSLLRHGMLQPILVRPLDPEVYPDAHAEGKHWIMTDGGRRYFAACALMKNDQAIKGLAVGEILVMDKDHVDPLYALQLEFESNRQRKDFTWRETALYLRQLHEAFREKSDGKWTARLTAEITEMGEATVAKYLQLTEDLEVFNHPDLVACDGQRSAYVKYQILMERRRRDRDSDFVEQQALDSKLKGKPLAPVVREDYGKFRSKEEVFSRAKHAVKHTDCRPWLAEIGDNYFDWIHWDPPYGGDQGGGMAPSHGKIDDSEEYSWSLMDEVVPQLWRTLKDGGWMAFWFNIAFYERVSSLLRNQGFYVNKYPYLWIKDDKVSGNQDIRTGSVNAYETFFLVCKSVDVPVVLPKADTQNYIIHPVPRRDDRTHPMQKPVSVLEWIVSMISYPLEMGCDPSLGSGTIAEAAFALKRTIEGCEIDDRYVGAALESAVRGLIRWD